MQSSGMQLACSHLATGACMQSYGMGGAEVYITAHPANPADPADPAKADSAPLQVPSMANSGVVRGWRTGSAFAEASAAGATSASTGSTAAGAGPAAAAKGATSCPCG